MAQQNWSNTVEVPLSKTLRRISIAGHEEGQSQEEVHFSLEQRRHHKEMAAREKEDAVIRHDLLENLSTQIQALPAMVEEQVRQWQPFIVELALKAAQTVVHQALDRGDYNLVPPVEILIDRALKITTGREIMVIVNPADLDFVSQGGSTSAGIPENVRIESSTQIGRGQCLIQTDEGRLSFDPEEFFQETATLIREELISG